MISVMTTLVTKRVRPNRKILERNTIYEHGVSSAVPLREDLRFSTSTGEKIEKPSSSPRVLKPPPLKHGERTFDQSPENYEPLKLFTVVFALTRDGG